MREPVGIRKTYVYHERTRVTPSLSILLMNHSRNTMLRSPFGALSERSYDPSTGQAGTAGVERRIVAGHLRDITVSATNRDGEK